MTTDEFKILLASLQTGQSVAIAGAELAQLFPPDAAAGLFNSQTAARADDFAAMNACMVSFDRQTNQATFTKT